MKFCYALLRTLLSPKYFILPQWTFLIIVSFDLVCALQYLALVQPGPRRWDFLPGWNNTHP